MNTSRDRVLATLRHEPTDRVPRDLWAAPGIELLRADELGEMLARYPRDIVRAELRVPRGQRVKGAPHEAGEHTDAWGCVWQTARRGGAGELKHSPLADGAQLAGYQPPWELIERANFAAVNRACAATSRFVLAWTEARPLDRLQFLRGREAALSDLARGAKPARDLLDMLHDFFAREIEAWADTDIDGLALGDDWGAAQSALLPLDAWRGLVKPLYREFCEALRARDKFVFFRSGGGLPEILEDLVEIGVDAVSFPVPPAGLEALAERFRSRVTFWVGADDPRLPERGRPADVRESVRRVRAALDFGRGGVIAQCPWDLDAPFDNVAAMFEQWLAPLPAHAHAK